VVTVGTIGEPERVWIVEPAEAPVPAEVPVEVPAEAPVEPVRVPA